MYIYDVFNICILFIHIIVINNTCYTYVCIIIGNPTTEQKILRAW